MEEMTIEQLVSLAQHVWPSDRRMWSVDAELPKLKLFAKLCQEDLWLKADHLERTLNEYVDAAKRLAIDKAELRREAERLHQENQSLADKLYFVRREA